MPQLVTQGGTITFDAYFENASGAPVDPTTPQVSVEAANGTTIVNQATPTRAALGHYQYTYTVPVDAALGAWQAIWYGIVTGQQIGPLGEGFTVISATLGTDYAWAPTTADVARLVANLVLDSSDTEQADFSSSTVPTDAQVEALIIQVAEEVHGQTGTIPTTPIDLSPLARFVTAQGVAAWVVRSWFPNDPHADELQRIYENGLVRLAKAVDDVNTSGDTGAEIDDPLPVYGFPDTQAGLAPVTTWTTDF